MSYASRSGDGLRPALLRSQAINIWGSGSNGTGMPHFPLAWGRCDKDTVDAHEIQTRQFGLKCPLLINYLANQIQYSPHLEASSTKHILE